MMIKAKEKNQHKTQQQKIIVNEIIEKAKSLQLIDEKGNITRKGVYALSYFSVLTRETTFNLPDEIKKNIDEGARTAALQLWKQCYEKAGGNAKKAVELFFNTFKNVKEKSELRKAIDSVQQYITVFSLIKQKEVNIGQAIASQLTNEQQTFLRQLGEELKNNDVANVSTRLRDIEQNSYTLLNGMIYYTSLNNTSQLSENVLNIIKNDALKRAYLNRELANKFGNLKDVAKTLGMKSKGKDNVTLFTEILNEINNKGKTSKIRELMQYYDKLDAEMKAQIDNMKDLDILSKVALLKTLQSVEDRYGKANVRVFLNSVQTMLNNGILIPSQTGFPMFYKTLPYVIKNDLMTFDDLSKLMAQIVYQAHVILNVQGRRVITDSSVEFRTYWNPFAIAYGIGGEYSMAAIDDIKNNYLRRMTNLVMQNVSLLDPRKKPSFYTNQIPNMDVERGFGFDKLINAFRKEVDQFITTSHSQLKLTETEIFDVRNVSNPRITTNYILDEVLSLHIVEMLETGKVKVSVRIPIEYANFPAALAEQLPAPDVMPSGWTHGWFRGSGTYAIRTMEQKGKNKYGKIKERTGYAQLEVITWGPMTWQRGIIQLENAGDRTRYVASSQGYVGQNVQYLGNKLHTFNTWVEGEGKDITDIGTVQGFFGGQADTLVGLSYSKTGGYKVRLWRRQTGTDGKTYYRFEGDFPISDEQARELFGAYLGHGLQLDALAKEGERVNFLIGYNFTETGTGVALVRGKDAYTGQTQSAVFTTQQLNQLLNKNAVLGAVVVTDSEKVRGALANYWGKNTFASTVVEEDQGNTLYGMALSQKISTYTLAGYFAKLSQTVKNFGVGFESTSKYAFLNLIKDQDVIHGDLVLGGKLNVLGKTYNTHFEYWDRLQRGVFLNRKVFRDGGLDWVFHEYMYSTTTTDIAIYNEFRAIQTLYQLQHENLTSPLTLINKYRNALEEAARIHHKVLDVVSEGIRSAAKITTEDDKYGLEGVYGGDGKWFINVYNKETGKAQAIRIGIGDDDYAAQYVWSKVKTTKDAEILAIDGIYKTEGDYEGRGEVGVMQGYKNMEQGQEKALLWYLGGGNLGVEGAITRALREVNDKKRDYTIEIGTGKYRRSENGWELIGGAGYGKEKETYENNYVSSSKYYVYVEAAKGEQRQQTIQYLSTVIGAGKQQITSTSSQYFAVSVKVMKGESEEKGERKEITDITLSLEGEGTFLQ